MRLSKTGLATAGLGLVAAIAAVALWLTLDSRAAAARIEACVQRLPAELRAMEPARQHCQSLEQAGLLRRG